MHASSDNAMIKVNHPYQKAQWPNTLSWNWNKQIILIIVVMLESAEKSTLRELQMYL